MQKFPLSVYVACSLTYAPEDFKSMIEEFKRDLGLICDVLCFNAFKLGSHSRDRAIYLHDIQHCVKKADLVLAFCDHPSTGLGYEIGTRIEAFGKPALLVAHEQVTVSNMLLDMGHPEWLCEVRRYTALTDVLDLAKEKLATIWGERNNHLQLPLFDQHTLVA